MDADARHEAVDAREAAGVAGMAPAGNQQQAACRPPAVAGAGADRLGQVAQRANVRVRSPVGDAARVVVAVVGGGALVDFAIGPDADLDALPIVPVESLFADHGSPAQGGGVGVVGPVLDVEVAGAGAGAVGAGSFCGLGRAVPAIDDVDEGGDRQ